MYIHSWPKVKHHLVSMENFISKGKHNSNKHLSTFWTCHILVFQPLTHDGKIYNIWLIAAEWDAKKLRLTVGKTPSIDLVVLMTQAILLKISFEKFIIEMLVFMYVYLSRECESFLPLQFQTYFGLDFSYFYAVFIVYFHSMIMLVNQSFKWKQNQPVLYIYTHQFLIKREEHTLDVYDIKVAISYLKYG